MQGETIMDRETILKNILNILQTEFEIENPGLDDNLREKYEFDSIDAIALLESIEDMLGYQLTQEEKKAAMDIKTISQICDFIQAIIKNHN